MIKKILVIDDEKDILESLAGLLRRAGYKALTADTGQAGLDLAKQEIPDLIVLDLMLPDIDGGEVAAQLFGHPMTQGIPVVVLTSAFTKNEEASLGPMIDSRYVVIAKPCTSEQILALVKNRIGPGA